MLSITIMTYFVVPTFKFTITTRATGSAGAIGALLLTVEGSTASLSYTIDPCKGFCWSDMNYSIVLTYKINIGRIQAIKLEVTITSNKV